MAQDQYGNAIFNGATSTGLRNVGSYQVSGHPFITGSTLKLAQEKKISFPYVTKKVSVIASGAFAAGTHLRVHFASTSSGPAATGKAGGGSLHVYNHLHFIELNSHEDSFEFDVKCKEIYVSSKGGTAGFMLYASLTNIPTGSMYALTGSGITKGTAGS
tara:strand:+ start:291 stop:767 length:477 start_codon:yes stop_codon:yes gene_type:complete